MSKKKMGLIVPGGVDEYIAGQPEPSRKSLTQLRALIRECAPDAVETVSYFQIPGYSYPGYDYNGMFAWFSYQKPHVRLHVRPPVLENNHDGLKKLKSTKAIVWFPADQDLPRELIAKLVVESIHEMKGKSGD
ncbi:MAG: DUF1801 domain-containing protein [Spirochaetales bacterium]